jgi:hypothetical protein
MVMLMSMMVSDNIPYFFLSLWLDTRFEWIMMVLIWGRETWVNVQLKIMQYTTCDVNGNGNGICS